MKVGYQEVNGDRELWEATMRRPTRERLLTLANRMLEENPVLARELELDDVPDDRRADIFRQAFLGTNRTKRRLPVDRATTEAMFEAFKRAGYPGSLVSVSSLFRHRGWVQRSPQTHLPEGPTRTLYHFTSTVHFPVILQFGISRGDVCVEPNNDAANYNAPWLTSNPSWTGQGWAEDGDGNKNSVFDKRTVRLTVEIPEGDESLSTWAEVCQFEQVPDWWRDSLNAAGGHEDWFVYNGLIPSPWISKVDFRDAPATFGGQFGFLRSPA